MLGLAAGWLLVVNGKIAGISGITAGALDVNVGDRGWRLAFLGGLVLAGLLAIGAAPWAFDGQSSRSTGLTLGAGLLVGLGTRLGSGCTSGHGICGLARFSVRSLAAVLTFMATGFLTVFVTNHVLGGLR